MIKGVSSTSPMGVVAMTALRYAQPDGANVVLPVRRADMIYASFRHIQVRPDSRIEDGIPLYKLKILDALIDSYSKNTRETGVGGAAASVGRGASRGLNAETIDLLISEAMGNLKAGNGGNAAYRAGLLPEPGAFVDLAA
jgi:hypothetical protein